MYNKEELDTILRHMSYHLAESIDEHEYVLISSILKKTMELQMAEIDDIKVIDESLIISGDKNDAYVEMLDNRSEGIGYCVVRLSNRARGDLEQKVLEISISDEGIIFNSISYGATTPALFSFQYNGAYALTVGYSGKKK